VHLLEEVSQGMSKAIGIIIHWCGMSTQSGKEEKSEEEEEVLGVHFNRREEEKKGGSRSIS
jgi:hypothetical protein